MTNAQTTQGDDLESSTQAHVGGRHGFKTIARRALASQYLALLAALAVLLLLVRTQNAAVFSVANLIDIGVAVSIIGILALAQTVVLISGGLDISIGSIAGLASVCTAMAIAAGFNAVIALAVALGVGVGAGGFNAFVITRLKINPIIATLATFSAFSGLALVLSDGRAITAQDPAFRFVGIERIFGLPIPLIMFLSFALAVHLFLTYTILGRHIYALGSNSVAARNTGISLVRYKVAIYTFSGLVGGAAGALLVARTRLGTEAGTSVLGLTAITAALLGGAALTGGRGKVVGVVLGVALLGVLDNGLVLTRTPPFYADVAVGLLLIVAIAIQEFRRRAGD